MSDSQKFGGGSSTDVADQPLPEQADSPASKFTPKVMMVGGAIVVVLALAAYFLLFSGGGATDTSNGLVAPAPHSSTAPSKAASAAPSAAPAVAGGGLSSNGRDPFAPLVTASTPSASTAPTSSAVATTPAGGTTTPAGVKSTLKVNSVNFATNSANVLVDGKPYIAYAGQLFAKYYTLKVVIATSGASAGNGCAVFNFGDLPAQLCTGQSATFTG